jgi:hypothetical protein
MKKVLYGTLILLFIIPYASMFSHIEHANGPEHRYANCIVTGETSEYHYLGLKAEGELVLPHFNYTTYTLQMNCNGEKVGFESLNSRDTYDSKSPTNGCNVSYATKPESLYIFGIKVLEDEGFSDMSWSGCEAKK